MKKLLIAAAVAAFSAAGAQAADIAPRPYTKAPPVQTVNWTGFYAGVSGGLGGNERDSVVSPNDASAEVFFPSGGLGSTALGPTGLRPHGGFGGVQAGYNFQSSRWLLGIETDFNFSDIKSNDSASNLITGVPAWLASLATTDQLKWFGTARMRFGFLATSNLLLFGTGGLAYGRVDQAASYTATISAINFVPPNPLICIANVPCFAGSKTTTEVGYTVGAGAEWLFWKNLSLKAEYSYINFGNSSYNINATAPTVPGAVASMRIATELDYHVVRAGLNWHL